MTKSQGNQMADARSAAVPFFSILMPAWNTGPWITAAIRSVLAQTCANWELIIVDDGSTDTTIEIISGFSDTRIRLIKTMSPSQGPGRARSIALAAATGEYVVNLDSDDLWPTWTLSTYLRAIVEHNYPPILFGNLKMFDDGTNPEHENITFNTEVLSYEDALSKECVTAGYQIIERSHAPKIYSDLPSNGEDWDFIFRIADIQQAVMIRTPVTYLYRRRNASLSSTRKNALGAAVKIYGRQQAGFYPGSDSLQQARTRRARHEIFVQMRPVLWQLQMGTLLSALFNGIFFGRGLERLKFAVAFLFHALGYAINDPLKNIPGIQHFRIALKNVSARFYPRDKTTNILVMQVNHFGDSVCFLPTLDALRRLVPTAHISFITSPYGAELVKGTNLVDEVLAFNPIEYKRLYRSPIKLLRTLAKLRIRSYDAVLADPNDPSMSPTLGFLVGAPIRIGFNTAAKGRLFFTKRFSFDESRHVIENSHRLVSEIAAQLAISKPIPQLQRTEVRFSPTELNEFKEKFKDLTDKPMIFIHPFSKYPHKEWSVERFSGLTKRITSTLPHMRVIVATDLRPFPTNDRVTVLEKLSLRELAWLIAQSALFIGNNSGAMNLAIAMGTPTLCLTGASPLFWWPYKFADSVVSNITAKLPCSPCENLVVHQSCARRLARPECMEAISIEKVLAEIVQLTNSQNNHVKVV